MQLRDTPFLCGLPSAILDNALANTKTSQSSVAISAANHRIKTDDAHNLIIIFYIETPIIRDCLSRSIRCWFFVLLFRAQIALGNFIMIHPFHFEYGRNVWPLVRAIWTIRTYVLDTWTNEGRASNKKKRVFCLTLNTIAERTANSIHEHAEYCSAVARTFFVFFSYIFVHTHTTTNRWNETCFSVFDDVEKQQQQNPLYN